MKLVLNCNWGGFRLPEGYVKAYRLDGVYDYDEIDIHTDPRLIAWVEDHADKNGRCGDLAIKEIPDTCTDYEIDEYDGWESVIYVVNGKIHHG